ncbi:MAG: patatin-like phospholipase family protein [Elusimicrobia bacterium]|nr:patatin-like phospholipase family protein [Elusimicrobiota bacterium]
MSGPVRTQPLAGYPTGTPRCLRAIAAALGAVLLFASPSAGLPGLDQDSILRDHLWRDLTSRPRGRRPTVGLVLSGGSLRALAHAGVYSVLQDAGFPVDVVSGVSMGAVLGSAIADGVSGRKLSRLTPHMGFRGASNYGAFGLFRLAFFDSPLSSEKTEAWIDRSLSARRFEDLKKPFACVAMDIKSGEAIVFREGPLSPAVRASMNLPGIFSPVEYRHRYLVDGGVVDFIPVDAARLIGAEFVIASVTDLDFSQSRLKSVLNTLEQVIDIRGSLLAREQRKRANFLIEPRVPDIGFVESPRALEVVAQGVIAARRLLPAAQESLIIFSHPPMAKDWMRPGAGAPGGSE